MKDFGKRLAILQIKFDEIYKRTRFHGFFKCILTNGSEKWCEFHVLYIPGNIVDHTGNEVGYTLQSDVILFAVFQRCPHDFLLFTLRHGFFRCPIPRSVIPGLHFDHQDLLFISTDYIDLPNIMNRVVSGKDFRSTPFQKPCDKILRLPADILISRHNDLLL